MYQPADHLLWDVWFAHDGRRHHAYYLQAPRPLDDPEDRHALAEVGHATSTDLRTWREEPPALRVAPAGAWDDRSIWTGSVLVHGDGAHLFYTAACRADDGRVQRIGHARSTDLSVFHRVREDPILEVDPVWYETVDGPYDEVHWRDPYAVLHEGRVHLFVTARTRTGPWDERGTIALATSDDLRRWTVHPPVVVPGDFWVLEVPQVLSRRGRWWMLVSTVSDWHAARRRERLGPGSADSGVLVYVADRIHGPYTPARDDFLVGDRPGTHYTGKILETDGGDVLVMSRLLDPTGRFLGALVEPVEVRWDDRGPWVDADAVAAAR